MKIEKMLIKVILNDCSEIDLNNLKICNNFQLVLSLSLINILDFFKLITFDIIRWFATLTYQYNTLKVCTTTTTTEKKLCLRLLYLFKFTMSGIF